MWRFLLRSFVTLVVVLAVALVGFRWMADQREVASAEALRPDGGRFVETSLGQVHVIEAGPVDGTPALLIHGSVGWSLLWEDTMVDLAARGYRAIAMDLAPMGLSERSPEDDYSRQAQGARVLALVATFDRKTIIVAHSFGAGAAAEAVLNAPNAFDAAIFVAGAVAMGKDGAGREGSIINRAVLLREYLVAATVTNPLMTGFLFKKFIHRKEALSERHIEIVEEAFLREGTSEALARWAPTLLIPPVDAISTKAEAYAALDLPVALIWGRQDTVTPPEQGEALAKALDGAPLFWLDDIGHIPQIEDPALFHDALNQALKAVEAAK